MLALVRVLRIAYLASNKYTTEAVEMKSFTVLLLFALLLSWIVRLVLVGLLRLSKLVIRLEWAVQLKILTRDWEMKWNASQGPTHTGLESHFSLVSHLSVTSWLHRLPAHCCMPVVCKEVKDLSTNTVQLLSKLRWNCKKRQHKLEQQPFSSKLKLCLLKNWGTTFTLKANFLHFHVFKLFRCSASN